MNITFAAMLGGWEIVLILAVVLILFGAKRIPELAKGLGTGIREFKKASKDFTEEINNVAEDQPKPALKDGQTPPQTVSQSIPQSVPPTVSQPPSQSGPPKV